MGKLDGKVAIVTGASKGIGAGIAQSLAAEGASVVVNYASSKEGADVVVDRITEAGGKAVAVGADVSKPEEITKLIDEAVKAFGGTIDVLVNNAAIYGMVPLEAITPEHFHSVFNLNVLGVLLTTQAAVPYFPETGGSVINIGSVAGTNGFPATSVYSATKGAINALTVVLSKELGPKNIRVNAINPGLVETEGTAGFKGMFEAIASQTPLGRVGQPVDIARVVTFFASDDAYWITGEAVTVSGGIR